jgi:hypothetical protein
MQNYNKAHKLKFKATKKQQKIRRLSDRDSDSKSNSTPKETDSPKNNNSKGKKDEKNTGKKSGEATPMKSALLTNRHRNQRRQISHHLEILELQVEQLYRGQR